MGVVMGRRAALGIAASMVSRGIASADDALLPLRMMHDNPIAWLPLFVAHDLKLWQASGVAPSILPSTTGMATLIALTGGAADIGIGSELTVTVAALTEARSRSSRASTKSRTWSWPAPSRSRRQATCADAVSRWPRARPPNTMWTCCSGNTASNPLLRRS